MELNGDHMTLRENADGSATFSFDDKGTGRVCGSCTLCCKLVPVAEIGKAAGKRCDHARHGKGCMIYARRPWSCRTWSCRWRADPSTAGLPRPDRCHYVIDLEYDHIANTDQETGKTTTVSVLQVWVDPAFPKAHEAPELRAYLLRMAEEYRVGAIIRYDSRTAFMLWAPPLCADGQWHIQVGTVKARDAFEELILNL